MTVLKKWGGAPQGMCLRYASGMLLQVSQELFPCFSKDVFAGLCASSMLCRLKFYAMSKFLRLSVHRVCRTCAMGCAQDPKSFVADMKRLFDNLTLDEIRDQTSEVIGDIMECVRKHHVDVKGIVSTVVVTTLVLEGWSSKLNPDVRIMDTLKVAPD